MAPSESSTKVIYLEFDLITLGLTIKPLVNFGRKSLYIASRLKSYTGVLDVIDLESGKLKSERFLDEYNGDIWTTTNLNSAKGYASGGLGDGLVFTIFGKTKNLAKMPEVPENLELIWNNLPFYFAKGKFRINSKAKIVDSKDIGLKYRNIDGVKENRKIFINSSPNNILNTNDIFELAKLNKYDGILLKNINDMLFIQNRRNVELPIDEYVYKTGTDVIKAPLGTTKLDLIKDIYNNTNFNPILLGTSTLTIKHKLNE